MVFDDDPDNGKAFIPLMRYQKARVSEAAAHLAVELGRPVSLHQFARLAFLQGLYDRRHLLSEEARSQIERCLHAYLDRLLGED